MIRHRLDPVRLRAEILKRGMNGQAFALAAGISPATLSNVVNDRPASPRTLTAIVRALLALPEITGMADLLEAIPTPTVRSDSERRFSPDPPIECAGETAEGS